MNKIYKYTLPFKAGSVIGIGMAGWENTAKISIPKGAEILSAGNQHESLVLWALVDVDEEFSKRMSEVRTFLIQNTGGPLPSQADPDQLRFIGTVLFAQSSLVFHVFEVVQALASSQASPGPKDEIRIKLLSQTAESTASSPPSGPRTHECHECGEPYSCTSEADVCASEADETEELLCRDCFYETYGGCS